MKLIIRMISLVLYECVRGVCKVRNIMFSYLFATRGKNVTISNRSVFTFKNIHVGSDVYIGPNATFLSSDAYIHIGNKVMIGPNSTIITGNHRYDVVGEYMFDVKEKRKGIDDCDVFIDDDVWIGANVVILKGVRIGTGSIIGAGSLITHDVSPYKIVYDKRLCQERQRWEDSTINSHQYSIERKYCNDHNDRAKL